MIAGQRVLAIIPARGGSKGLKNKNILTLAGKPLIAWTIEAALASRHIDHTITSTDSDTIAEAARAWQCPVPFLRPPELALDNTPTADVVLHAAGLYPDYELLVVLQPTSPLRTGRDIDSALQLQCDRNADGCTSVTPAKHHPAWMRTIGDQDRLHPIMGFSTPPHQRQSLDPVYSFNGAIYSVTRQAFLEQHTLHVADAVAYPMPAERSHDIDTALDFRICEALLSWGTPDSQ